MTEMTKMADILSTVSTVAFALAAICLALAIYFWFKHKIPAVIGDLSGNTARKSIEKMRETNEKSGNKTFKPSYINSQRGRVTETMTSLKKTTESLKEDNKRSKPKEVEGLSDERPETGLLEENRIVVSYIDETMPLAGDETELLVEETDLLTEETEILSEETSMLYNDVVTDELTEQLYTESTMVTPKGKKLTMIDDIVEVHTDYSI